MDKVLSALIEVKREAAMGNEIINHHANLIPLCAGCAQYFDSVFGNDAMYKSAKAKDKRIIRLRILSSVFGRPLESTKDLLVAEALAFLDMAQGSPDYLYQLMKQGMPSDCMTDEM